MKKWISNETSKYIIVLVLFVLVAVFLLPRLTGSNNVFFDNNKKTINAANSDSSFSTGSDAKKNLFPEIRSFINEHPELGAVVTVTQMPDWAFGKRQSVELTTSLFKGSFNYLFYTRNDKVVTVYKINPDTKERTMIWDKSNGY